MPTKEHLEGQWREWRHKRIAELSRPYGWPSLVAQHWLREGDSAVILDGLPGTWGVDGGRVIYTPPASGPTLSVDGVYPIAPVEVPPGRNQTYGHFGSVAVYFGVCEIETLVRTTDDTAPLYGVRVRDPRVSAEKDFSGLASYPYDPAWRLPAIFTPSEREDVEQVTVEAGVRETTTRIGTVAFDVEGVRRELVLIGKDSARGVIPVAHVRDVTSGPITYGAGRVVEVELADDGRSAVIDFNYATALPCAFTNYVTCPLPPRQNVVDFAITAGELKPDEAIDRVPTFFV